MGGCCCHAESPCDSAEERSGLLKDDAKTTAPTGHTDGVGACGPEGGDDKRLTPDDGNTKVEVKAEAVQGKQSPEVGETKPNNARENGPSQEPVKQTATASPRTGSDLKENSTTAQEEDPKDGGQAEVLRCTLNSLQEERATVDWQVFPPPNEAPEEEDPASARDKTTAISAVRVETVCPENHNESKTTREHILSAATPDNDEDDSKVTIGSAAAEPSEEFPQDNEVLSVPNTRPTAAARQEPSISVVSPEIDKESPSCAVTELPESESPPACEQAAPEVKRSHGVSESSPGPGPAGPDHSGEEERASAKSAGEPEATAPADASGSSDLERPTLSPKEVTPVGSIGQDIREEMMPKTRDKDRDAPKVEESGEVKGEEEVEEAVAEEEEEESAPAEAERTGKDAESQEETGKEEQAGGSSSAEEVPAAEREDGLGNSEEDLYRGAEELSASLDDKPGPPSVSETALLKVEERCSLAPAMDILSYSEREWKGNTAKSALIRKGYKEMSQRFGSLRRVRGDNYCALRATLFQVLSHSTQLPEWLQEDVIMLPKQLEAQEGLISQWTFPGECLQGDGTGDASLQLKGYMERLRNKWQAAVDCSTAAERQRLCERAFQGGEEELGLLEALKLLMLGRAVELHGCMQAGGDVPLFCWLLFARDSSDCPRSFLSNHLSHVGLSAGLEQVEMFLLGYALQCTIQVYRLYKADTEEFFTYYPDDHKDDWPSVCLVTEDDRHYNVPVVEAAAEHRECESS